MKLFPTIAGVLVSAPFLSGQPAATTNSIGMELVLIRPGSMVVGVFQPPYLKPVDPNAPPVPGRGGPGATLAPELFAAADKNNDGKLTRGEFTALASDWFAKLDPDKTGKLNAQDFATRFATLTAPAGPSTLQAAGRGGAGGGRGGGRGGPAPGIFTAADLDKDGSLTADEFRNAFGQWFTNWDKSGSGSLNLDQLTVGLNALLPQAAGRGPALTEADYKRIAEMAKADSSAGFPVNIDHSFYIGKYEVTQAQWRSVMGTDPAIFQGDKVTDDAGKHPVENITWDDAQAFIKKLNAMEKTRDYRLPTEFEWEYAARAGGEGDIPWTQIREQAITGYNSYTSTHTVGEKKPNAWGLYDMLGNVWEWVGDYYNGRIFPDPVPAKTGSVHVLKGGGFLADVKNAIPATHAGGPGSKFDVGMRLVRNVP